jgi:site-specific DNA-adenine methylase
MSYRGNKRLEVEDIYKYLNLNVKLNNGVITTICEPFCGSSALSYYISTLHPNKFTYILNDLNKELIKIYKILQNREQFNKFNMLTQLLINHINKQESPKKEYLKIININDVYGYYICNGYYSLRPGLFPNNLKYKDISNKQIIKFLRTEKIILLNDSGINVLENYKNNKKILLFLDPPYICTENSFYTGSKDEQINIYEYIIEQKKIKNIYLILEYNWIIKNLFKDYLFILYPKKYNGMKKKSVTHCIIY